MSQAIDAADFAPVSDQLAVLEETLQRVAFHYRFQVSAVPPSGCASAGAEIVVIDDQTGEVVYELAGVDVSMWRVAGSARPGLDRLFREIRGGHGSNR